MPPVLKHVSLILLASSLSSERNPESASVMGRPFQLALTWAIVSVVSVNVLCNTLDTTSTAAHKPVPAYHENKPSHEETLSHEANEAEQSGKSGKLHDQFSKSFLSEI